MFALGSQTLAVRLFLIVCFPVVNMTLAHDSHLWQLTVEQQRSTHDASTLLLPFLSSFPLSSTSAGLAETAACISCVQMLVPGQQKQEKSFDTDVHTVSISTLSLQIHLINSIYGSSSLVCICGNVVCLNGSSN